MLEIGAGNSNPGDLIKDVNEDTFMTDVVEASQEVPVIVDFWAPWCGPCKTLGPMLEKAVLASKGAVRMVKVNIDDNQAIAAQLRVQSIPTVFAFHKGQPIAATSRFVLKAKPLKRTASQYRRRCAVGGQDVALMFCDSATQRFGDCWHFRIGGKKLQHALVLLGRWHDLRRRVRDTHTHCCTINIRSGQRTPHQIRRTPLGLLLQTMIEQGNDLGDFTRRRLAGVIAVAVFSAQGAIRQDPHIPKQAVLS